MNKLFNLNALLILLTQIIYCDQQQFCKLPISFSDFKVATSLQRGAEGFLAGTLIKTVHGYVPVEHLVEGDFLAGVRINQITAFPHENQVIYIQQDNLTRYVQLQIGSEFINVALNQQFYLSDGALKSACDLQVGDILSNGNCVFVKQIVDEPSVSYSLCTQQHSFFIYPEIYVHNFDVAMISASGALVLGAIEVLNPVTLLVGIVVPLTIYAVQQYRSQQVHAYEFDQFGDDLSEPQIALKNTEALFQTRNYYEVKRRALINLYQDLVKIKNDLAVFIRPNYLNALNFSHGFLSQFQSVTFNFIALPDISHETALSLADKEKLITMRDGELEKLQQEILDLHLVLAFHFNEIIERRDQAHQELNILTDQINKIINQWNIDSSNVSDNVAFEHYRIHFVWKEMLDHLEMRTNEVKWILAYYEKLKNHFFVSKTTTLFHVLADQCKVNNTIFESIKSNCNIYFTNIDQTENLLRSRGFLSQALINQYRSVAQQYRAQKENVRDAISNAKKKKNAIQELLRNYTKNQGSLASTGGPDPDDEDEWKKQHPHGRYEESPKHHQNSQEGIGKPPRDGQTALDNSVGTKNSSQRVAIQDNKFVVLKRTSDGVYHGYIVEDFDVLTQKLKEAFYYGGLVDSIKSGRIKK